MKKDENRTRQAKHKIFEQIELLLDQNDMSGITFSQIAKMCGCQPNSISYYFRSKMDMLLEFTQYFLDKDTLYQSSLTFMPSLLHPVEGFCKEIDKIFSNLEEKSKIRRLSNYFLIINAAHYADFKYFLDSSFEKEIHAYQSMIRHYQSYGILNEERLRSSYAELCFQVSAFSVLYIFKIPVWDYVVQVHNVKEHLKSSFLKDHLYKEQLFEPKFHFEGSKGQESHFVDPKESEIHFENSDETERNLERDNRIAEADISHLQMQVYGIIEALLEQDKMSDITFAYLAKHCFCQTSSIAYYFRNKMDMLLKFSKYQLNKIYAQPEERVYVPPEGLSDVQAFRRFTESVFTGTYQRSKVVYWINYLMICNASANREFYDYLCLSIHKKFRWYWSIVQYYNKKGILNGGNIDNTLYELCFFSDMIAIMKIFQIPVVDEAYFIRSTHDRLFASFLKSD